MVPMFCDFHIHTTNSDGKYTPEEILEMARRAGIGVLAFTDHNIQTNLEPLRAQNPDLVLVQGSEISCLYTDTGGESHEIHMVALGYAPEDPGIQSLLAHNQPDRRPYMEKILERLSACGIPLGTYDDLVAEYPNSRHVGRMHIARKMVRLGFVPDVDAAFDGYIGARGRAYVKSPLVYGSLEDCVRAVLAAGGVPVLAHLFYYNLSDEENRVLLRRFKDLAGARGAMETSYAAYAEPQRRQLRGLAAEFGLMASAASDFHGKDEAETLDCGFPCADFAPLLHALKIMYVR